MLIQVCDRCGARRELHERDVPPLRSPDPRWCDNCRAEFGRMTPLAARLETGMRELMLSLFDRRVFPTLRAEEELMAHWTATTNDRGNLVLHAELSRFSGFEDEENNVTPFPTKG